MSKTILVVEDDETLRITLTDRLISEGYQVKASATGKEIMDELKRHPVDLIILDLMLPGQNGLDLCRDLRQRGYQLPILMLTAKRTVVDRVVGLKLGADDYVTKPFDMMELLARVEALLRRTAGNPASTPGKIRFGDLTLDVEGATLTRDGREIELSALEFKLLKYFVKHPHQALSRDLLLDEVWGYDAAIYSRTVDVHVASLRQKIETHPERPELIVTVHRVGYRFIPPG